MKKSIIAASLVFATYFAWAQEAQTVENNSSKVTNSQKGGNKKGKPHATPDQKADKFMVKINEAIKLEEAQKAKVRSLALDHFKTMENVRAQANGDKEKIKAESVKSRKIFNEGLKKVLSPTQFDTWKVKRKEAAKKQGTQPAEDVKEGIDD